MSFKVLFPILMVLFLVPYSTTTGQSPEREYTLLKVSTSSLQLGERQCTYFLWSKLGMVDQRVGFNYQTEDAKFDGDTPKIAGGYITILIDPSKSVPTAQKTKFDANANPYWIVRMDQATYDHEKDCLVGVPVKSK